MYDTSLFGTEYQNIRVLLKKKETLSEFKVIKDRMTMYRVVMLQEI